jgi:hypothetical protein
MAAPGVVVLRSRSDGNSLSRYSTSERHRSPPAVSGVEAAFEQPPIDSSGNATAARPPSEMKARRLVTIPLLR